MKKTFNIELIEKHLIIRDGGNTILVDTGSPVTIHTANRLEFMGKSYPVTTNAMGNTIQKLTSLAEIEFTTLMGLDILSDYRVIVDYPNLEITFCTHDEATPAGTPVAMSCTMGAIIIPVTLKDESLRMILDTGATNSPLYDIHNKRACQSLGRLFHYIIVALSYALS